MKRTSLSLFALLLTMPVLLGGCPSDVPSEIAMPHAGPFGAAVTPDGTELYIPLFGDFGAEGPGSTVAVISTESHQVVAEITVGSRPEDVEFSEDGRYAYVTNSSSATVSVIDTKTRRVVKTIPLGTADKTFLTGIVRFEKRAYVTSSGGNLDGSEENIFIIDIDPRSPTFHQKIGGVTLSGVFGRPAVARKHNAPRLVVPRGMAGNDPNAKPEFARFDLNQNAAYVGSAVVETTGGFHAMEDVAVTRWGEYAAAPLFTTAGEKAEGVLLRYPWGRGEVSRFPLGAAELTGHGTAIRPDDLILGITNWNVGKVTWIFLPTLQVYRRDIVGENPNEIAFTADGTRAYVTNQNSKSVSVLTFPGSIELVEEIMEKGKRDPRTSEYARNELERIVAFARERIRENPEGTPKEVNDRFYVECLSGSMRGLAKDGEFYHGEP